MHCFLSVGWEQEQDPETVGAQGSGQHADSGLSPHRLPPAALAQASTALSP